MASRYPTRAELLGVVGHPKPGAIEWLLADALDESGELLDDEEAEDESRRRGRQRPARKPRLKGTRGKKWKVDVEGLAPSREWAKTREICFERAGQRCERCGKFRHQVRRLDPHHRKLVSRGGRDDLSNLACLCDECHRWCHDNDTAATLAGWIVPSWADPERRGVTLWDDRIVLFDDEGGYAFEGRPLRAPWISAKRKDCRTGCAVSSCFSHHSSTIYLERRNQ